MGRNFIIKREPVTSLSAYVIDSMLLEEFQTGKESKADALRRIFTSFFGEEKIREKREELQKKLDRQKLSRGETGDQLTVDNMYFPKNQFKDLEYNRMELLELIIEARDDKTQLAKRNADDSLYKALDRGDVIRTRSGGYQIVKKWF